MVVVEIVIIMERFCKYSQQVFPKFSQKHSFHLLSSYLQFFDTILQVHDGPGQLLHCPRRLQLSRGGGAHVIPGHDPAVSVPHVDAALRDVPLVLQAALALAQLARQLPDGPVVHQDLVVLLQDHLAELLRGGPQVRPVFVHGSEERIVRLLLLLLPPHILGVAVSGRDRCADQAAEAELFGGACTYLLPEVELIQSGDFQPDAAESTVGLGAVQSSQRAGMGHRAGLQWLEQRLRAQGSVVAERRGALPGINTGDDADDRPEEGEGARSHQNHHKLHSD